MKSRLLGLIVVAITLGCGSAWSLTPSEAADAGKSDGQARNGSTNSGINTANGSNYIPNYNNTSPEAAYFAGGNGNVGAPTSAKLAACAGSTSAECVAINLMQNKASTANPMGINPLSPLIQNAKSVRGNPTTTLGATAAVFVDPPSGESCSPGSQVTGTGATQQTCESRMTMGDVTCQRPWDLQIQPWWTYTCQKATETVTTATCDKTLQVTVDWVPNCELASNVAEIGFGWDYRFRSGPDLYVNGGVVRAKCFPSQTDTVKMTLWGGDVSEGQYGASGLSNPPPNPSLLPSGDTIDVPVSVTAAILAPTSNILILPGSGCTGGNCSYRMSRGPKMYGCQGGLIGWTTTGYLSSNSYLQATYDEGAFGDISYINAHCYSSTGVAATADIYGSYSCNSGYYFDNVANLCYAPIAATPAVVGAGSGGRSFNVNFVKPAFIPKATDNWINTCAALEASPTCSIVGQSCTDGPSTKNINGADIARACWHQVINYECVTQGGVNGCQPLIDEPACSQNAVDACVAKASDGSCTTYQAGYKCTKDMGPPAGVTQTGHGYDKITDALNNSACQTYSTNPDCVKRDSTCTDTGSKTFFGFTFTKDCWNYQDTYTCPSSSGASAECQALIDKGCTDIPSMTTCSDKLPSGTCDVTSYTYQCGTPYSASATGATCENTPYCINGVCYDRQRPSDPDFGTSVAGMETQREVANYIDAGSMQVFQGAADTCTRRTLVNCCKANGGASGSSFTNGAFYTAADFGRTYAGSEYMYDVLNSADGLGPISSGLEAMGILNPVGPDSFSAYGLTVGWGPSGFEIVAFDPWSFAAQIAVQIIITELMSCDSSDKQTAVKKDQGICQLMGTYCSSKFLGACLESKESYCCFNSKLAKAINIQGKQQLGIPLGNPEVPNCRGLTIEEVQKIDMTKIDLSDFLHDIVGNALSKDDAKGLTTTSITNRNPCKDAAGNVDASAAGRMDCKALPAPSGSASDGPAASPPPPPPPTGDLMPDLSAIFTPAVQEIGQNITRSTSTVNAQSLTFSCTGAQPSSGTIPIGAQLLSFPALASAEGKTVCEFLAVNGSKTNTVEASYEVTKPHPTVSANVAPNPVTTGSAFTATVTTTNATSGKYTCSGAMGGSGTFDMGTATVNFVAPGTAGTANCVFEADGNGFSATTSVTITFVGVAPKLTVSATPTTVTVGDTITITTVTDGAATLQYTCTGSLVTAGLLSASGTMAVGTSTLPLVTNSSSVGSTSCEFKATSSSGGVDEKSITMLVTTPATSLSAAFTPSDVKVGQPYALTTNAIGMSALSYSCVGPKVGSGSLPVGNNVINYTAIASEVGTTVCTFTSTNALTGETTTTNASITVRTGVPVVTAQWSSATVRDGDTVYLNTSTTDAISLSYTCPAPMASSGALPLTPTNTPFTVNSSNVGTITCTLTATGDGSQQSTIQVTLVVKPLLPTVTAAYTPSNVTVGQNYSLITNTTNAVTLTYVCTGVNPSSGSEGLGAQTTNLTAQLSDVGTKTCVFTASNSIGETATATATLTVVDIVPTLSATWTPATVDADQPTALVTQTTNAQTLTYACTGAMPMSGSLPTGSATTPFVLPGSSVGTTTCVLTATSSTGHATTATAVLTVNHVIPTVTASWSPSVAVLGNTPTLSVTSTRAVSVGYVCTGAHPFSGSLAIPNSSTTVTVDLSWVGTTTCVVTATSMTNDTATASAALTVNNNPPTVSASANPNPVRDGDTLTLSATSTNASSMTYSCTGTIGASGSIPTPSGSVSMVMGPSNVGTATCTVTATGDSGSVASTVNITVNPKLPTVTASFSPSAVYVHASYQLITNTSDAVSLSYSCTGPMAGSGSRATGSQTTSATAGTGDVGTTTCTFTAANSIGETATATATMTVNAPIIPTITASISTNPVRWGSSTTFSTSTTQAVSVTYSCTGLMPRSGSLAVPNGSVVFTPAQSEVGTTTCTATATSVTGDTATASVNVFVWPKPPTMTVVATPAPPMGAVVDAGQFDMTYTFTDTSNITTTCGAPLGLAGHMVANPTNPNGTTTFTVYPYLPNVGGTSTCTAVARNSIGETVTQIFYLLQIKNGCWGC